MEKRGKGCSCVLNRMLRAGLFCYVAFGQRLRKIRKHSGAHVVSDNQRVIMSEGLLEVACEPVSFRISEAPRLMRGVI